MASPVKSPRSGGAAGEDVPMPLFRQAYSTLFQGADPSDGRKSFWDEFFLVKVDKEYLCEGLNESSEEDLVKIKDVINILFMYAVDAVSDRNQIRSANAMQTIACLFQCVFAKRNFKNFSFDVINVIMGYDVSEERILALIRAIHQILRDGRPGGKLKDLALRLVIIITTATTNINQNVLLEHLMTECIFSELMQLLERKEERDQLGYNALLLLGLLMSYRRNDHDGDTGWTNPYIQRLTQLSDDVVLNAVGSVMSAALSERNNVWLTQAQPETKKGLFASFFSGLWDESEEIKLHIRPAVSASLLLPLYDIVQKNAGFITVLTHTRVLSQGGGGDDAVGDVGDSDSGSNDNPSAAAVASAKDTMVETKSTNLLSSFLTFASFVLHDTKTEQSEAFSWLCLAILRMVTEDANANVFLHDDKMKLPITLYHAAKRHRQQEIRNITSGPLATAVLDLCIEFLQSHLKKKLQVNLYSLCLSVIHRLLCHQKKNRIRMAFEWKTLWTALVGVGAFVVSNEQSLSKSQDVFGLCRQIVNIFNLFITYGDTFLPDPNSYDELYYELMRMHSTFESIYEMAKRCARGENADFAQELATDLLNIRSITNHFIPRISTWSNTHGVKNLSPEQVLAVVRDNYEFLTLKLQDNLEQFTVFQDDASLNAYTTVVIDKIVVAVVDAHQNNVKLVVQSIPVTQR